MGKPIIAIIGATGRQGSGVPAKLAPNYQVRCLTRNASSDKAKALVSENVELVEGDVRDETALRKLFKGAYGVFAVTDYYQHPGPNPDEKEVGCRIADLAKEAGVTHFIYSSLPSPKELTRGKLNHVTHFETKVQVVAHMKAKNFPIFTVVYMGCYLDNLLPGGLFAVMKDGTYTVSLPMTPNAPIQLGEPTKDYGKVIPEIFRRGEKTNGKTYLCATVLTLQEVVDQYGKVKNVPTRYQEVEPEVWQKGAEKMIGPELAQDFTEMILFFAYFNEVGWGATDSVDELGQSLTTWQEFLKTK